MDTMTTPKPRHLETPQETTERERCEQWTDELFRTSPMVRFMAKHLTLLDCNPLSPLPPLPLPPLLLLFFLFFLFVFHRNTASRTQTTCDGDIEKAERTVDEVFESCFGDTRPFDEIY
ncbi:hypothetical protein NDA13_000673 [Ustilago tritici]|nr:hypothetical protein NDA13_000673 [Ustilago tritici]